MSNLDTLKSMISEMTANSANIDTMNSCLLTSIAASLAIIADHIAEDRSWEEE